MRNLAGFMGPYVFRQFKTKLSRPGGLKNKADCVIEILKQGQGWRCSARNIVL